MVLQKIREYILGTSRIARLDSKAELLRAALAKDSVLHSNSTLLVKAIVPKRKRIGRMNMTGQPKLFGGSLEEYLDATGEEIPLIMRSCIRIINLYGNEIVSSSVLEVIIMLFFYFRFTSSRNLPGFWFTSGNIKFP